MSYTGIELDILRSASTCAVSDALDTLSRKQWVMDRTVRLLLGQRIFGPAVTVLVAVTGEKAHHKVGAQVLDESEPGTVVLAAGEPDESAVFGAPEIAIASHRKLGGLVTDCAIRPRSPMGGDGVGVAAAGFTPAGGFGRIKTMARNATVNCAGVQVSSGDLVIGDATGIVVVPASMVSDVARIVQSCERRIEDMTRGAVALGSVSEAVHKFWTFP